MIKHAHGYEVEGLLSIRFLLLQDFLFRHSFYSKYILSPTALRRYLQAAYAAKIDEWVNG